MKLTREMIADAINSLGLSKRWGMSQSTANRWINQNDFPKTATGFPHHALSEAWVRANTPTTKRADAAGLKPLTKIEWANYCV